jgi:hypothetical protein
VTSEGPVTSPVEPRGWSNESLPPLFVDLPVATRIARNDGGNGAGGATLKVWNPSGKTPVVAWMVGDRTVNA